MQTAFHIYALAHEINDSIIGAELLRTEFYKKQREAYIFFKNDSATYALGLAYHPVAFGTFLLPARKMEIETAEKPWPFFQPAEGAIVQSVTQLGFDRIIQIGLKKEAANYAIIIEAIGPNGNLWLLDGGSKILASLRHRKYEQSQPYMIPAKIEKLLPIDIQSSALKEALRHDENISIEIALKKNVTGLDDLLSGEIVYRAGLKKDARTGDTDDHAVVKLIDGISEIAQQFHEYDKGFVYDFPGGSAAYPFRLKTVSAEPEKYKTLSMAVYRAIRSKKTKKVQLSEKDKILDAVNKMAVKLKRKTLKIEQDILVADKFNEYRRRAELLKINLSAIEKGMSIIELKDSYGDGKVLSISLNPAMTASENAEEYFKKYRKAKEALELLKRRSEITQKELESIRRMQDEFEQNYEAALDKHRAEISAQLPGVAEKRKTTPRLPYKSFTLSTGLTIYVGRDGADNDMTTFHHAKPYELWFHASQCPGSHIVMKFPDKNFKPSKAEIAETAAIAAYHSKARHSKTVPVIYTERKYVHKPRKAKPGLVTVEREKMVMVEPKITDQ